jgi:hypothetical protein
LLGAIIEVYVSEAALLRVLPNRALGQITVGLFAGMLLPTCECGIVPVARKLLLKGTPPRVAIPYMMAAPVVNPVVIGSTIFAFQGEIAPVAFRLLLVVVPAFAMGLVLGDLDSSVLLRRTPAALQPLNPAHGHAHTHDHACGCGCCSQVHEANKLKSVIFHTTAEFLSMSRFLILGAIVAAGFKTYLPSGVLELFTSNGFLAIAGLMLLAVLLSICSEADAFVAASFAGFPLAAKVGFMAIGPMVDLKLIPMFYSVFHRRLATALVVVPTVTILFMAMVLHMTNWVDRTMGGLW